MRPSEISLRILPKQTSSKENMENLRNKSGKVSKKKLEAFCKDNGIPLPIYEAFGRKVCAFWLGLKERGKEIKRLLSSVGLKMSDDYYDGDASKGIEATNISYFKAWHWDE